MGMFDTLQCRIKLPVEFSEDYEFQTKSFACPFLDRYEIRADGTLWREHYDIEDHSDPAAQGWQRFAGSMTRVNRHWQPECVTQEVRFHGGIADNDQVDFSAYFVAGVLHELHRIEGGEVVWSDPGRVAVMSQMQVSAKAHPESRVRYGQHTAAVTAATGMRGTLCVAGDGQYFFRIYEADRSFVDYALRHSDLEIAITDTDAYCYDLGRARVLDHGPSTLGLDSIPDGQGN